MSTSLPRTSASRVTFPSHPTVPPPGIHMPLSQVPRSTHHIPRCRTPTSTPPTHPAPITRVIPPLLVTSKSQRIHRTPSLPTQRILTRLHPSPLLAILSTLLPRTRSPTPPFRSTRNTVLRYFKVCHPRQLTPCLHRPQLRDRARTRLRMSRIRPTLSTQKLL